MASDEREGHSMSIRTLCAIAVIAGLATLIAATNGARASPAAARLDGAGATATSPAFAADVVSGPLGTPVVVSSLDPCVGSSVRVEFQQISAGTKTFTRVGSDSRFFTDSAGAWQGTLTVPADAAVRASARIAASCEIGRATGRERV